MNALYQLRDELEKIAQWGRVDLSDAEYVRGAPSGTTHTANYRFKQINPEGFENIFEPQFYIYHIDGNKDNIQEVAKNIISQICEDSIEGVIYCPSNNSPSPFVGVEDEEASRWEAPTLSGVPLGGDVWEVELVTLKRVT